LKEFTAIFCIRNFWFLLVLCFDRIALILPSYIMKQFGLIGYPLGHSFSKKYFEEKFATKNLQDCVFDLFPIKEIQEYKNLVVQQSNLIGLAVTIPYKETVMPLIDKVSDAAKEIGAVNCIQFKNGKSIGYNTDIIGFKKSLLPLLQPQHTKALILGTGGASKAVQYVLKNIGINFLLVSRTENNNTITYEDISEELLQSHFLIINTTPLGMSPNEEGFADIPYQFLTTKHLLYDLIYKPEKTLFLQKGEQQGCMIKNGFEMLVLQAEENWKIWNQ
jgi:shikimate dehydrogenase